MLRPDLDERGQEDARHILDHLRSTSPTHSGRRLLSYLADLEAKRLPRWGLRASWGRTDNWDRRPWDEVTKTQRYLVYDQRMDGSPDFARLKQDVLEALLGGPQHEVAEPLVRRLLSDASDLDTLLRCIAFFAWQGRRAEAMDLLEKHLHQLLQNPSQPSEFALTALEAAMHGTGFSPLWKQDPKVAKRWISMALLLRRHLLNSSPLDFVIQEIHPTDYRQDTELTMRLGWLRTPDVLAWARGELSNPDVQDEWFGAPHAKGPVKIDWNEKHPALLPLQVLLAANTHVRDDSELTRLFCRGGRMRLMLLEALGTTRDPGTFARQVANTPGLTRQERLTLVQSLAQIYAAEPDGAQVSEDASMPFDLMVNLLTGGRIDRTDAIRCP